MQRYHIAGLKIDLESCGRTVKQAAPYAAEPDGPADLTIQIDPALVMEHTSWIKTVDMAHYMGTGARFAGGLLNFQGFMLHSSAIVFDGKAYLFSAPSGTGKSTHTEKWIRLFGAECLNDDKPALRLVDGVWMAYGTPWSGKHDLSSPMGAPLGGIAVLRRGEENSIAQMASGEALPYLMSQTVYKLSAKQMEILLGLMDDLLGRIPVWDLCCRNDDEAAIMSHKAMTGKGEGV